MKLRFASERSVLLLGQEPAGHTVIFQIFYIIDQHDKFSFMHRDEIPGLGSGTLWGSTASQLSLVDLCSLNWPSKALLISCSLKPHTADPPVHRLEFSLS